MKLLMLTVYLVNVLTFGEIHPFGLRIRASPHFIRKLLALGNTPGLKMHRGSQTAGLEESCAGTDMVTGSVFMQIHKSMHFQKELGMDCSGQ